MTARLKKTKKHAYIVALAVCGAIALFCISVFVVPPMMQVAYVAGGLTPTASTTPIVASSTPPGPPEFVVTHIATPEPVKALYMTSWVAGTPSLRNNIIKIIDETEINAVVIDIKDYTGRLAFEVDDPMLTESGVIEKRIANIKEVIGELHKKNIYVIGRLSVFQDAYMVKQKPQWAVKRASDGGVWKDRKGISWIDAGAEPFWDYITAIGKASYAVGFDEINFDYIRFPSDGDMKDIAYPYAGTQKKALVLKEFFKYLDVQFRPHSIPISADLFGMTTTNSDDLGIGQVLENALPYFDFIAPMVYPSHYPTNFMGFANPAAKPYEVIHYTMKRGVERAHQFALGPVATTTTATSTPPVIPTEKIKVAQLRPWLQDFNLGATYTPEMVRAQINATYDVGLTSWMLWDAANTYTRSALYSPEMTNITVSNQPQQ